MEPTATNRVCHRRKYPWRLWRAADDRPSLRWRSRSVRKFHEQRLSDPQDLQVCAPVAPPPPAHLASIASRAEIDTHGVLSLHRAATIFVHWSKSLPDPQSM